jgi:hypothetical protein
MTALIHTLFPSETAPVKIKGEVRFVAADERSQSHGTLGLLLTVCVPAPPWSDGTRGARGGLRDAIESAIESALEMNDAPPPGVGNLGDLDQCLSDQLYRARSVGAGGLVLCLPDLTSAGNLAGALDAEDSAVLRWWIAATGERPVMLLLDDANRHIGAYGPPTRLEYLVEWRDAEAPRMVAKPAPARQPAEPTPAPARSATNAAVETPTAAPEQNGAPLGERPPATSPVELTGLHIETAANRELSSDTADDGDRGDGRSDRFNGTHGGAERFTAGIERVHVSIERTTRATERTSGAEGRAEDLPPHTFSTDRVVPLFPRKESPFHKPTPTASGFAVGGGPVDWRGFANDLATARGPKPLNFVERLFMTRYMPLLDAIASGDADESARRIAEQWADDFARSYTEGFSALKVTGKRPRMVLDAPQLASQVARLHGAKSTQLVLVDAMRFDLGVRVHDRMCEALTSQATCTERILLWSALPTTTPAQLDLLAHGPEGLATRPPVVEPEEPGLRGRAAPVLRRIKVGGRDLLKLDLVQARLHEAGPPLPERLDALADEVAAVLAAHARNLPPRSLMLVFGDHGFRMESSGHGTTAGSSGGARPEEVLVPGFAWLVGDVH